MCRIASQQTRLPRATSSLALKASRDGAFLPYRTCPIPKEEPEVKGLDEPFPHLQLRHAGYVLTPRNSIRKNVFSKGAVRHGTAAQVGGSHHPWECSRTTQMWH